MEEVFVIFLLQRLGFMKNLKKSVIIATQKIECLGLIIDSVELTLSLIAQKLGKKYHLYWELYKALIVSVLELTKLICLLSSTAQVIFQPKYNSNFCNKSRYRLHNIPFLLSVQIWIYGANRN